MAVEMLARSFSHEFNNVLGGILGPAQLLAASSQDAQLQSRMAQITQSVHRGILLTGRLSAFGTAGEAQQVDLHAQLGLLASADPQRSISLTTASASHHVLADQVMLMQILRILMRILLREGESAAISTANFPQANHRAVAAAGKPDAWIQILIACDGRAWSTREREVLAEPLTASVADSSLLLLAGAVAALRHSRARVIADDAAPLRLRIFLPTSER